MPSLKSTRKATTPTLDPLNKCSKCSTQLTGAYPGAFEPVVCYTCRQKALEPTKPITTTTRLGGVKVTPIIAANGLAVALADLAEAKGMTIEGVSDCPHFLAEAGLPEKIGPTLGHAAHRIYRDRIDAVMWRCNRPLNQTAPILTRPQAEAHVAKVEQEKTVAKAAERAKAVEASQPKKNRPVAAPVVAEAEVIEF